MGGSRLRKVAIRQRDLLSLYGYSSNYITLHRIGIATRATPLDPHAWFSSLYIQLEIEDISTEISQ